MRRVSFEAEYPTELAHPIHRELSETEGVTRIELLAWSPAGRVKTLLWFDGDESAVRRLLAAVESLVTASLVSGSDGTYAFLDQTVYELADEVMDVVSRSQVVFLPPVTFLDFGAARFDAVGESDQLATLYDALRDVVPTSIRRVHDFERQHSPMGLTDRQRTALDVAVDVGYYAVPRTGSVADVAAELDCATSTAGELLRRAEATVVADYVRSQ
ncbi:bacterio-opsin activator [Haloprofundus marisrubri]|uniref:Bacterio-opsin activator n=1 Tax=Haloprofundus marisrubri TaxID=1514971 RepID=A0A0W1R9B8_9EURY|nr:helix-turn-helix domain-containing protein [Haloprofundus marisrubri]KTG09301.1 bacterio-opsin activator [Haloprofundus marisrubri]